MGSAALKGKLWEDAKVGLYEQWVQPEALL